MAEQLKKLKLDHVLIIVEGIDEKLFLAARNLPHVEVLPVVASQSAVARELRQGADHRRRRETHRGAPAMSAAKSSQSSEDKSRRRQGLAPRRLPKADKGRQEAAKKVVDIKDAPKKVASTEKLITC